jgi:tetratricopeptide (TPR) repeat protein
MQAAIDHFFVAIHSRYDIEQPAAKRLIRRELNVINQLREENLQLKDEWKKKETYLKKLSTEYVLLGKECEAEKMYDAASRNYEKALSLYPDHPIAKRQLRNLMKTGHIKATKAK